MTVKIIAENILDDDDFSSATEQDGQYIGQPDPDSGNTGFFRLISKGDDEDEINTFSYSGTATGNGATNTMVDSVLSKLGDDYLIGMTIAFTSGANDGLSRTISDFTQSSGTITFTPVLGTATATNDTFTLSMDPDDISDIDVELTGSGDAGTATYKWRYNDSTNYLGRDAPTAIDWDGLETIDDGVQDAYGAGKVVQAPNGDWLCIYTNAAEELVYKKCTNGLTWGSELSIDATDTFWVQNVIALTTDRILAFVRNDTPATMLFYSDDSGSTWSSVNLGSDIYNGACELPSGNIYAVYSSGGNVYGVVSTDKGLTYSSAVTISSASNTQENPAVVVDSDGNLVCVYESDEDSAGDEEIKCKTSTDGGATWGSVVDVATYAQDYTVPDVCLDIDGSLYCVFVSGAGTDIYYSRSTDNGATWTAAAIVRVEAGGGDALNFPKISLLDGHILICTYLNDTDDDLKAVRRGYWESYSTSAQDITVPKNALESKLLCDIGIKWYGNAGISSDSWSFSPEYEFAMENMITDNPDRPWRSENDNGAVNVDLDMGANERMYADGIAFFGSNLRALEFKMDSASDYGSLSTDEAISFDLTDAGEVDSVNGNYIEDAALMADYADHELVGKYVRMTSGTDSGVTFKIKDNVDDYIVFDTTDAHNVASTDTFAIYQNKIAATFTADIKRYLRVAISAQHTYDDYYQIGSMVVGRTISLTKAWLPGYSKTVIGGVELLRPSDGGIIPIERRDNKRIFKVQWNAADTTREEIVALYEYLKGKNLALIPDDTDLTDVYLVKMIGNIELQHWYSDRFNFDMTFEEV